MAHHPTGTTLFFGALRDLVQHPSAVVRMSALPLALYLGLEAFAARGYVAWFNDLDGPVSPPTEILNIVAFFAILGVLASSWHRFMILGERPGYVPKLGVGLVVRYVLAWFVIGLIVGLIVLVAFGVPLFIVGALMDPLLGQMMLNVIAPDPYLPVERGIGITAAVIAIGALAGASYFYLLFRMGMGMPSVAVRGGEGMGMRASWRATRGLARAIATLVVLALIGQAALFGLSYASASLLADGQAEALSYGNELLRRVSFVLTDTTTTLIGAAILTRIYRALPDDAV